MGDSGAGGKLIDEKNQKRKISWHCPFKETVDNDIKIIAQMYIFFKLLVCKILSNYLFRYLNTLFIASNNYFVNS